MKQKIKIFLSGCVIGGLAFILSQFYGCSTTAKEQNKSDKIVQVSNKSDDKEKHSCCSSEMDEAEYSENSIYQLESTWINQSGKTMKLTDLSGKPVVMTMFFASCTYACPILVNDMKKIEAELPKNDLKKYRFVLVSIDDEKDTPEVLSNFAKKHNLDLNRWTLLAGSKDNIYELAAVLGFKFKKDEKGEYSHSNLINILNKEGEIEYQHTGLNQDITIASGKLTDNNL